MNHVKRSNTNLFMEELTLTLTLTSQQLSNHGTNYLQVLLIWKMEVNLLLSYLLKKCYFNSVNIQSKPYFSNAACSL